MAGIYSQGGSAGHRYAGDLVEVEAKNFQFGGKVFNGSPSAIYVGSKMVWTGGWLTAATVTAILRAFGQRDGWAVINATNAYLTQLAASDRDKATALAGFINEDPMMVCSLPMSEYLPSGFVMPDRMAYTDGSAWIETGYYVKAETDWTLRTYLKTSGTSCHGVWNKAGAMCIGNASSTPQLFFCRDTSYAGYGNSYLGATRTYRIDGKKCYADGNLIATLGNANTTCSLSQPIFAYKASNGSVTVHASGIGVAKSVFVENGIEVQHLIPCKHKTQGNGMLDLVNVVFYPNAGSGSFTIPDISYTPSTP